MEATKDPAESPEQLVNQALELKASIARQVDNLQVIEGKIIALGGGKYAGTDGREVTVIPARPGSPGGVAYGLEAKAVDQAKKLAGEQFSELFDRHVSYTPCAGFVNVVPKLLTKAKARDLLALCAFTTRGSSGSKAYLQYPK